MMEQPSLYINQRGNVATEFLKHIFTHHLNTRSTYSLHTNTLTLRTTCPVNHYFRFYSSYHTFSYGVEAENILDPFELEALVDFDLADLALEALATFSALASLADLATLAIGSFNVFDLALLVEAFDVLDFADLANRGGAAVAAVVVAGRTAGSSGVAGSVQVVGTMTLSRTWMTPFDAKISAAITLASSKVIPSGPTTAASSCPESALTGPVVTSELGTLPKMTWLVRMQESSGISASKLSTVPAGSLANALSVGAEENE